MPSAFELESGIIGAERPGGGISVLVLDRPAIAAMGLPGGMIYRYAHDIGRDVRARARELLIARGSVRSGDLLRSVAYSAVPVAPLPGTQVNVRATDHKAIMYIRGTPRHDIDTYPPVARHPRRIVYRSGPFKGQTDWGWMRFFWLKGGYLRFEQHVDHPGWRGYNFLDDAKDQILAERGIII